MSTMIPRGNIARLAVVSVAITPASVPSYTTSEQTFPLDVRNGDLIFSVSKPKPQPGIAVVNGVVAGDGLVKLTFMNLSAAAVLPTAKETYSFLVAPTDSVTGTFA